MKDIDKIVVYGLLSVGIIVAAHRIWEWII